MTISKLTEPFIFDKITLRNRVVMAPMNRRRADNGMPTISMITYYSQRASAGLIITDNTAVASNGGAYWNTPAIFDSHQIQAWKKVSDSVHASGGKIFMQLVHSGRVGHPDIQRGEPLIAPSKIKVNETIWVPDNTYQPMAEPLALKLSEIPGVINTFRQAAINAIDAGFDGIEIHAAHGFLIDQFINPHSNSRSDEYGGSIENKSRFLLEVTEAIISAIGKDRTGVRLSPFRELYDLKPYPEELATHQYIIQQLQQLDILYLHFSNAVTDGRHLIPIAYLKEVRKHFKNVIIVAGGYTPESAEKLLTDGLVDLVAFGKLFISNPDLVERIRAGFPLAKWEEDTFYRGGDHGYIDYPVMKQC